MNRHVSAVCAPITLLVCASLGGCATTGPFTQFYTSATSIPVARDSTLVPYLGDPTVIAGTQDKDADARAMFENGYALIGSAGFSGPLQTADMAKARAKELQAAAVVLYGSNPQSVTQQVPVLDLSGIADVLNPPKTTTTTSGTIYGSGGSVGYNQTSTTTAPPTRKQPRTVEESYVRYDQLAMFWAKAKPRRLGVDLRDLDDDDRMRLGGNRGMRVDAVVKGSPAFLGDMLRGDIVTAIDDVPIRQESDVTAFLAQHSGKEVSVHVVRRDEKMTLRVRLGD